MMRISRPRPTVRLLMAVVLAVAVAVGVPAERRRRFEGLATRYREGWDDCVSRSIGLPAAYQGFDPVIDRLLDRTAWYAEMTRKYERAARYPWLPVPPDPPVPR